MGVRIFVCASLYGGQSSCFNSQQILPLAFGLGAREEGVKHSLGVRLRGGRNVGRRTFLCVFLVIGL